MNGRDYVRHDFLLNSKFRNNSIKMNQIGSLFLISAYKYDNLVDNQQSACECAHTQVAFTVAEHTDTTTRSVHSEESTKISHTNEWKRLLHLETGPLKVTVQKHGALKTGRQAPVKLVTTKIVCTLIMIIRVIWSKHKKTVLEVISHVFSQIKAVILFLWKNKMF